MVEIKPIQDLLYAEIVERKGTMSGIIIPGAEKGSNLIAKVLGTGRGETSPVNGFEYGSSFQKGDYVLTMQYMGERREIDGEKLLMIREHGIWAKLTLNFKGDDVFEIIDAQPMSNFLIVEMDKEEKTMSGALHLPSNPATQFRKAKVISVGPGKRYNKTGLRVPIGVQQGEEVICLRYAGSKIKIKKAEYRIVNEEDLIAVVEPGAVLDLHSGKSDIQSDSSMPKHSDEEIGDAISKLRRG